MTLILMLISRSKSKLRTRCRRHWWLEGNDCGSWNWYHIRKDEDDSAIGIDELVDDEEERLPLRDQGGSVGDSGRGRGYFSEVGVGERCGEVASIRVDVDVDVENLYEDTADLSRPRYLCEWRLRHRHQYEYEYNVVLLHTFT